MKLISCLFILLFANVGVFAQKYNTFEMRYFTSDPMANGETDFHGENEWLNLDQRLEFLNKYGTYGAKFWNNEKMNKKILTSEEVSKTLSTIKAQPLTNFRKTIRLDNWKSYGYNANKMAQKKEDQLSWITNTQTTINNGCLFLKNGNIQKTIDSLSWRFRIKTLIKDYGSQWSINLTSDRNSSIAVNIKDNNLFISCGKNKKRLRLDNNRNINLEMYVDIENKRFYTTIDKQNTIECPFDDDSISTFTDLIIKTADQLTIDAISIYNFIQNTNNKSTPYHTALALYQDFNSVIPIDNWTNRDYDDMLWNEVKLPSVHGGLAEKEESYYLRKKVEIGNFERATIKLETLDPGGELWINGFPVAVINNRHPQEFDVTDYLINNTINIIAIRVKPHKISQPMLHTPSDHYIGWFLGRTELILTNKCMIKDVFAYTKSIDTITTQMNQINIQSKGLEYFEGSLEINYYPWFPDEGEKIANLKKDVHIRPRIENHIEVELPINKANLWTPSTPNLYRVEVILRDSSGKVVDDYMTTTGIRTITQKNGDLYINNKPAMLNGAQIMGSRYPIETIAKTNRCAPEETVIQDLLMIKKMNANMLRIHVHAEKDTTDGINDPRYAEYADQLGVFLLWQTAAWIREGEAWNVDFEGYPMFMKQVFNHPSIVMWEASNHPNRFKKHDISDSHDYINTIYNTIYGADSSRLISPTSFWLHTHYGNYKGSIDYNGNPIERNPTLMKNMITKGNQDAYTGYGAKWSTLRNAPHKWAKECLDEKKQAYFNFEHEESAAQPNWNLAVKEPWYKVQSYEWDYEKNSIGRRLEASEWLTSQAFQAFAAWESIKKQIQLGYDGFSWCSLESGSNMFTYQKPLVDPFNVPKLAYYANATIFNSMWVASKDNDVVYGPNDFITPVIFNLGDKQIINIRIELKNEFGKILETKDYKKVKVNQGRIVQELPQFRFKNISDGYYFIHYNIEPIVN